VGAHGSSAGAACRCQPDRRSSTGTGGRSDDALRDPRPAVDAARARAGCWASCIGLDRPPVRRDASTVRVRESEENAGPDLPAHAAPRESPHSLARWASGLGVLLEWLQSPNGYLLRRTVPEPTARLPRVGPLPITFSIAIPRNVRHGPTSTGNPRPPKQATSPARVRGNLPDLSLVRNYGIRSFGFQPVAA